jgi:L-threonylcarbamoyladenylate synthase
MGSKLTQLHTLRPDLDRAVLALRSDEVIGIPTETVYGLAASIDSEKGLKRIFEIKERPFFDPLIVHVSSFKQAQMLTTNWSPLADYLARKFWPGPLTLILSKAKHVNPLITSGLDTVGIRMPAHDMALEVIKRLGHPVAAPSANKFTKTSPSRAEHVRESFPEVLTLDGGACDIGVESTVIRVSDELIEILRPGAVTHEALALELKKWGQPVQIIRSISQASPGHLEHHYMPSVPLIIVSESGSKKGWLKEVETKLSKSFSQPQKLDLSPEARLAARELYNDMRVIGESGADLIYVIKTDASTGGFWDAIWDRLSRASSLDLSITKKT